MSLPCTVAGVAATVTVSSVHCAHWSCCNCCSYYRFQAEPVSSTSLGCHTLRSNVTKLHLVTGTAVPSCMLECVCFPRLLHLLKGRIHGTPINKNYYRKGG
eukprot:2225010-Amphidinium_carterae.1